MTPSAAALTPERVEALAKRILERAEFKDVPAPKLRPPDLDLDVSPEVAWLLVGLAVVLLAVVVFFLVRSYRARVGAAHDARAREDGAGQANETPRTATEAFVAAEDLARRGAFKDAVRLLHLALVLRLHEAGVLRFHDSLTNGECARQLARDPARATTFRRFSRRTDAILFGGSSCDSEDFAVSLSDYRACSAE